jgi:general secretion pathway protein J
MTAARRLIARPGPRTPFECGFTLLELLLAITILGLLMSVLAGGLRFGARAWESGDARAEQLTELGVVQRFLRQLIGQARPHPIDGAAVPAKAAFAGAPDGVAFMALAPARLAGGEFHVFSLGLEAAEAGRSLVLGWYPLPHGEEASDPDAGARRTVLLEGIETASFAYFDPGGPSRAPGWRESWHDPLLLPSLVRLQLVFVDRDRVWPDLLVRLMLDPDPTPP